MKQLDITQLKHNYEKEFGKENIQESPVATLRNKLQAIFQSELTDFQEIECSNKAFVNEKEAYLKLNITHKKCNLTIRKMLKGMTFEWFFEEKDHQKTQVEFKIDFELNNKFLNSIMEKSFNLGLIKIANAFENRANSLYDKV